MKNAEWEAYIAERLGGSVQWLQKRAIGTVRNDQYTGYTGVALALREGENVTTKYGPRKISWLYRADIDDVIPQYSGSDPVVMPPIGDADNGGEDPRVGALNYLRSLNGVFACLLDEAISELSWGGWVWFAKNNVGVEKRRVVVRKNGEIYESRIEV